MSDIFDVLSQYISRDKCAFLWDEGRNSYLIGTLPQPGIVTRLTSDSTLSSSGKKISGDEFFDIDSTEIDYLQHNVFIKLKFTFNTGSVSGKMELEKTYQAEYVGNRWKVDIDETLVSAIETFDNFEVISAWVVWKNPQAYNEGDWIDYDGKVYIALGSGNANNMDALLETKDYRHSIHYLLAFPKDWNINMCEPLDTAIFEALVARIIYKWLQYAYPDEAKRYLNEWEEYLQKIMLRCNELYAEKIVKIIPRI